MNPLISFIIPIFNTEQYLNECLESILNQSIDKEIILIDDGSTDESLNIALEYSKKYEFITVIHSQNKGQSHARNLGLKIARGEYIYFIDSDDYLLGNQIKDIYSVAKEYNIDIVKAQARQQIEKNGKNSPIYIIPSASDVEPGNGKLLTPTECLTNMVKNWIPSICWSLIKRAYIEENKLSFVENVKAEDQLFYIQLLTCSENTKVLEVGNIIYHYRLRANSTVTSMNEQFFLDHFTICKLIREWSENKGLNEEIDHCLNIIIAKLYRTVALMYLRFNDEQQNKYSKYMTQDVVTHIEKYLTNIV